MIIGLIEDSIDHDRIIGSIEDPINHSVLV